MQNITRYGLCALLTVLFVLPLIASDYAMLLANRAIIFSIIALSVGLLASQLGLVSLVQPTFAGLAGYVVAILAMSNGIPLGWAVLTALVFVQLIAALIGLLSARLVGVPFMMLTLALGQLFWALSFQWSDVTRGANGFVGIPAPRIFGLDLADRVTMFYVALLLAIGLFWGANRVNNSAFGLLLRGIRENEPRMKAFGHPVGLARFIFFQLTAFYAALGGLLLTWETSVITPTALDINRAIWVLTAVVLGGLSMNAGVVVGVILLVFLEATLSTFTARHLIVFGGILIFFMIAMPNGLVPTIRDELRRRTSSEKRSASAASVPNSINNP